MTATSTSEAHSVPARRADAARNRATLLDVARTVFASRGLDVPVEEIARAAGLGVGTVYRNFPTKEALVAAVIERAFDELTAASVAAMRGADPGQSFFQLLHDSAVVMARDIVMVRVARLGNGPGRPEPDYVRRLLDASGAVLARAVEAGAVASGLTAEDISALLIGIGEAANHRGDPTEHVERYVAILIEGLRSTNEPLLTRDHRGGVG